MLNYKLTADGVNLTVSSVAGTVESFIDTALGSASDLPKSLDSVEIDVEDYDIRITLDGSTPTASKGILVTAGQIKTIEGTPISQIKMIRATSDDASVGVTVGWSK